MRPVSNMLIRLLQSAALLILTVGIHTVLLSWTLGYLRRRYPNYVRVRAVVFPWLLAHIAVIIVMVHLLEIGLWAAFYYWRGALPNLETSFYFSSITYATVGYGDVVLPATWRLLAAMEGLTGILMCSWSGALFVSVVNNLRARTGSEP